VQLLICLGRGVAEEVGFSPFEDCPQELARQDRCGKKVTLSSHGSWLRSPRFRHHRPGRLGVRKRGRGLEPLL